MNESIMQNILMRYAMEEMHHQIVLPNATLVYPWETDLLTVTNSLFAHEFEIKISKSDYLADKRKKQKHLRLEKRIGYLPNYFWYATNGFEPTDIPDYAGWCSVSPGVTIHKNAPRLHSDKLREWARVRISHWLSYKLKNMYRLTYGGI